MKRLIYLKWETVNPDNLKMKPAEYKKQLDAAMAESCKQFKAEIKKLSYIKILSQVDNEPQFIIEYDDDKWEAAYDDLRKINVVEIIDAILPPTKSKEIKEESDEDAVADLKKKMEKYTK